MRRRVKDSRKNYFRTNDEFHKKIRSRRIRKILSKFNGHAGQSDLVGHMVKNHFFIDSSSSFDESIRTVLFGDHLETIKELPLTKQNAFKSSLVEMLNNLTSGTLGGDHISFIEEEDGFSYRIVLDSRLKRLLYLQGKESNYCDMIGEKWEEMGGAWNGSERFSLCPINVGSKIKGNIKYFFHRIKELNIEIRKENTNG